MAPPAADTAVRPAPPEGGRVVLPGPPMRGPTALGDDPGRLLRLTWTLAVTEFKLRFYGSVLGYLWQLMRPLLLFGVLYVVFTEFVRLGGDVQFYPVVLLTGIVLFTFIAEAGGGAVGSVVERESLIRKVEFPRIAIPASVVLTGLMNLSLNLVVLLIFGVLSGVELHGTLWQAPFAIALVAAFALGAGLLTSALFVRYRDVKPIWDVVLQMMFYGTPLLYPIEVVPESVRGFMMLNPLALANQTMRHVAIDPTAPSPVDIAGWHGVAGGIGITLVLLVVGFTVFRRRAPHMAEDL